ncbi:MAG: helix-turn-helix domain-containing protein [Devosia sp.]
MPTPDDKVLRILEAAGPLFLKHGLRGTSMEAIAKTAGIAKPTLYAYYADKTAVFIAIAEKLIGSRRASFLEGLRGEGGVAARIAAALINKHRATMRLLAASPHADELYGAHERVAGRRFLAFEDEIERAVEHELTLAGAARPKLLAQLLVAAAAGIGRKAQSPAELGPAIRLLAERLIVPELRKQI